MGLDMANERLDEREAAAYTKLSRANLEKRRRRGQPPVYARLGRRIVYETSDLDAFIESSKVRPINNTLKPAQARAASAGGRQAQQNTGSQGPTVFSG